MSIQKINPFAFGAQGIKPIQQTPVVTKQPTGEASGGTKPTEIASASANQNTTGVNTNIGVGDSMNIPAQAGKPAGVGKTLYFA